ncbi:MAG: cation:dicarboxylase symporter family transporter, partial [Christensenellaceae bacterium]|nr:cation:dicarboxylase symporter family transporter [Christensenellaceae bacterium]
MSTLFVVIGIIIFLAFIALLVFFDKKLKLSFTVRVLIALGLGVLYGVVIQLVNTYGNLPGETATEFLKWVDILGTGFVHALQFVVVPLVAVSIIKAITKSAGAKSSGRKSGKIILILLLTTAFSAAISIIVVKIFNLQASELFDPNKPPSTKTPADIPTTILGLIPDNLFAALSSNSVLPVVLIAALIGFAYLAIKKENPAVAKKFESGVTVAHHFVCQIVDFVITFTPYGVLGVITARAATGSVESIKQLGLIIIACFVAMIIVFIAHLGILWLLGANPKKYLKKTAPALLFAFSS